MATLKDVDADLDQMKVVITGLSNVISDLKQQIANALSGVSLPPNVQQDLDNVFVKAEADKQQLSDLLAANTPVPNPAPAPEPTPEPAPSDTPPA